MGNLYFQERNKNIFTRRVQKKQSSVVLIAIICTHGVFISLVLNENLIRRERGPDRILNLVTVLPQQEELRLEPKLPDLHAPRLELMAAPTIQFSEPVSSPVGLPSNESPSNPSSYENVFDPKMRQKLVESRGINRSRAQEQSKAWTAIDGRTFIEMGDGKCLVSMPKVDSRDRGTSWGMTTCGKDDSEKAMDRVMADFESRRQPLPKP